MSLVFFNLDFYEKVQHEELFHNIPNIEISQNQYLMNINNLINSSKIIWLNLWIHISEIIEYMKRYKNDHRIDINSNR